MNSGKYVVGSIVAGIVLIAGLAALKNGQRAAQWSDEPLILYCAAGMKNPVAAVVKQYADEYGVAVQVNYGGSGTLLSNLRVAQTGDLYLAADETYIEKARELNLVDESIPLAWIEPVIAVPRGNPKKIGSLADLLREDVQVALANPDAAAVGLATRLVLENMGMWEAISRRVKVFKPTVNDIANDLKIGSVDAGVVWDAVAAQYPELDFIRSPELEQGRKKIVVSILKSTNQPTAALRFARYLGARDRGLMQWEKYHFQPAVGDVWAETPHVVLFSGGVNRLAVEDLIQRFQEREGVEIDTVYNGCGILVGQMKLGERPDAYFSCDVSFVNQVKDIFMDPLNVSETDMVIVVEKGNPLHIKSLQDLTRPNLRLGVANAEQSALGALTRRLLEQMKIYDSILENVKSQTPTADLLVNQIRTGSLDAVIVYEANTPYVRDKLEIIPIDHPAAKAIQPYAVGKESLYPNLMSRLMDAICSETSRSKFESMGFRWLAGKENP